MKKVLVVIGSMLLAVSAFAAEKVDVTLTKNTTVNGTTLKPGDYKVVLQRDGDSVQATFFNGKKNVASTSGHFEQRKNFPSSVSLVVNDSDRALQQIVVEKMKGAVVLDGAAASSAGH